MRQRTIRGFSLVELLVVLGIMVCLVGILLPALTRAREQAKRVQCLSNLRQLTAAWLTYATQNDGRLCAGWIGFGGIIDLQGFHGKGENVQSGALWPYLKTANVYRCPDDLFANNASNYELNGLLAGNIGAPFPFLKLDELTQPAQTFTFIEGCTNFPLTGTFQTPIYPSNVFSRGNLPSQYWGDFPGEYHHGAGNTAVGCGIAFADGHAIFWEYSDPRTGNLLLTSAEGLNNETTFVGGVPHTSIGGVDPNSPDVYQLEAWSGGPVPPAVPQLPPGVPH